MNIPVRRPSRFDAFNESERAVIQYALVSLAAGVQEDAVAEEIDAQSLPAAGATFLQANLLAFELSDLEGEPHPSPEAAELMAAAIAEGDAPLAEKMAREAMDESVLEPRPSAEPTVQDMAALNQDRALGEAIERARGAGE